MGVETTKGPQHRKHKMALYDLGMDMLKEKDPVKKAELERRWKAALNGTDEYENIPWGDNHNDKKTLRNS